MGKKLNRIYEALVEGAYDGLADDGLYDHVTAQYPKTSSKRIVKAALYALSDPDIKDRKVLEAIYALAIRYRLLALGVETDDDGDEADAEAPSVSERLKSKLESSVAKQPIAESIH